MKFSDNCVDLIGSIAIESYANTHMLLNMDKNLLVYYMYTSKELRALCENKPIEHRNRVVILDFTKCVDILLLLLSERIRSEQFYNACEKYTGILNDGCLQITNIKSLPNDSILSKELCPPKTQNAYHFFGDDDVIDNLLLIIKEKYCLPDIDLDEDDRYILLHDRVGYLYLVHPKRQIISCCLIHTLYLNAMTCESWFSDNKYPQGTAWFIFDYQNHKDIVKDVLTGEKPFVDIYNTCKKYIGYEDICSETCHSVVRNVMPVEHCSVQFSNETILNGSLNLQHIAQELINNI